MIYTVTTYIVICSVAALVCYVGGELRNFQQGSNVNRGIVRLATWMQRNNVLQKVRW